MAMLMLCLFMQKDLVKTDVELTSECPTFQLNLLTITLCNLKTKSPEAARVSSPVLPVDAEDHVISSADKSLKHLWGSLLYRHVLLILFNLLQQHFYSHGLINTLDVYKLVAALQCVPANKCILPPCLMDRYSH